MTARLRVVVADDERPARSFLVALLRTFDDVALVGMQHMAFKRSDVAHGRIRSIDTSAAKAMPGV